MEKPLILNADVPVFRGIGDGERHSVRLRIKVPILNGAVADANLFGSRSGAVDSQRAVVPPRFESI